MPPKSCSSCQLVFAVLNQMNLLADIRLSFRALIKNPGFTAIAVMMLALGIGVNAAVFTVTNAVLFKGFPLVNRNDRILYIGTEKKGSATGCCVSYPDFEDWRAQSKSFEALGVAADVGISFTDSSGIAE